jgi:CheY-like chemotaxis protein/predicted regulator of Ras-like GTPase activity (Roadblock/LC7/MglB family)
MKTLLIADDETLFTRSLSEGLAVVDPGLEVLTAENGRVAQELLETRPVDLVLTDLKMPVMDGFELLAYLSRSRPQLPVLVMTAFGTPEISERLEKLGVSSFIEKPVDFCVLSTKIGSILGSEASGFVRGIPLPTFLQVLEIERKTCVLKIDAEGRTGFLNFVGGVLHDAQTGSLQGEEAAVEIVCWERARIEILGAPPAGERRIKTSLSHLILDSFRLQDEKNAGRDAPARPADPGTGQPGSISHDERKKEDNMGATDKLKELSSIEGFAGAGVYTPSGETLAIVSAGSGFTKDIGVLANNVLMNAQKASLEMGAGRGQQVHVEGEKAQILCRCLNEGTDPLKSQPGKAHIHMVIALTSDASIGMAKLRMNQVIVTLADDFRI